MIRSALAALAAVAALPLVAHGQAFPQRAVTFVVPNVAGGLPDTVARVVGQKLAERWGQPVVVENKPGANGAVAAQYLAQKPADGHTLLVTDGTIYSVNPWVYKSLTYDPVKDFTLVSLAARAPLFLAVHPSVPASNLAQLVAHAKARPGALSYGSSGIGSMHHLTMEALKGALGLDLLHVPFKGTGQSIPALASGQVQLAFSALPSVSGFVKEGRLKLVAVNSEKRSPFAPEVASVAETHVPGFDFAPVIGVAGPAGLPPALAQRIAADIGEVVRDPALREKMQALGIEPVGAGPAEYAAQVAAERERLGRAVKQAGLNAE